MLCKVYCACCRGIEVITVTVEVDVTDGISFFLVGLPDSAVKESQQRISSALGRYGFRIPGKKIVINMAPANIRKEGSAFDVAIAIGIICASGQIRIPRTDEFIILGELALDGSLRPVSGALPVVLHAREKGFRGCILPAASAGEGARIEGTTVFGADNIGDVIRILCDPDKAADKVAVSPPEAGNVSETPKRDFDFADIKGQTLAKRGLEIAAAGGHNVIMIGSPGAGKTFMAKCIPSILPPMTKEESIETSKIYSVAGLLDSSGGLMRDRPFRAPHHNCTVGALTGGGMHGMPGEVSLAHNGVLFLDEFAEFSRSALEMLRQPLEDGAIQICRVQNKFHYPASFMLVASMNPCPCGYLWEGTGRCRCSSSSVMRYMNRVSGPLLDRMDIQLNVKPVLSSEMVSDRESESSAVIAERVKKARDIQNDRYKGAGFFTNAQIPPAQMERFCKIGEKEKKYLETLISRLGLSARGYTRILKISRTIADLDGEEFLSLKHICEALQFRSLDRNSLDGTSV